MKVLNLVKLSLISGVISACSYPGALFVEDVQVGLDVSLSTQDTRPVNINLGYDQSIFAVAPKQEAGKEAVSLLSKSDLFMQFTEETTINNIFVSGAAADKIVENHERMKALFLICDSSETLKAKKVAVIKKLGEIQNDSVKVKAVYSKVFPLGIDGGVFDITDAQQRSFQLGRLVDRLNVICDPDADLAILKIFQESLKIPSS